MLHFRTNDDVETYIDRRRPLDEHLWLASPCRPPIVLSINVEARRYGLGRYQSLKAPYANLMVDPEKDMWWLEHRNRELPDYTVDAGTDIPDESHGLSEEDKKLIRNVLMVVPGTPLTGIQPVTRSISLWVATLGEVQDVFVACRKLAGQPTWHPSEGGPFDREDRWMHSSTTTLEMWTERLRKGQKQDAERLIARKRLGQRTWVVGTEHVGIHAVDIKDFGI